MKKHKKRYKDRMVNARAMRREANRGLRIALLIFGFSFLGLIAYVVYINLVHGFEYSEKVSSSDAKTTSNISAQRGKILDTNGAILAYNQVYYNLIIDPVMYTNHGSELLKLTYVDGKETAVSDVSANDNHVAGQRVNDEKKDNVYYLFVTKRSRTLEVLNKVFGLSENDVNAKVEANSNRRYCKLIENLDSDVNEKYTKFIEENKGSIAISLEKNYSRKYPYSSLACGVLGFANKNNVGQTGLEAYYEDELTGVDGTSYTYVSGVSESENVVKMPKDGLDIVTTIDYKIQSIIEDKIKKLNDERPSKCTSVVAMNPKNGEILALASYPSFDLNNPFVYTGNEYSAEEVEAWNASKDSEENAKAISAYSYLWATHGIVDMYEPGSTFKPFTVVEALEAGVTHDGDTFYCSGYETVQGVDIGCHVRAEGGHGTLTLEDGLIQSCNPVMIQLANRMTPTALYNFQIMLGFGTRTGIDLPNERKGFLQDGSTMTILDAACNSFGQNINVTQIQMAAAFSSIVNGGKYYKPHLVKRIQDSQGQVVKDISAELVRQTCTEETSQLIRSYLREGVDTGLARKSGVAGYAIGGKTGTAQKANRDELKWVVSVIGCVPTNDPQLVLYTVIDEPYETTGTDGSSLDALYLMHDMYEEILPYMNIYKDNDDGSTSPDSGVVEGSVPISVEFPQASNNVVNENNENN